MTTEIGFTVKKSHVLTLLPNDKIFDWSKFKAFADDKLNVIPKIEICFGENRKHCGKKRKCWGPTMFPKAFSSRVIKIWDCVVKD